MIYPIFAYGSPVLRKVSEDIPMDYEGLDKLIADMYETMYNADGVGLAAPQIGLSVRILVIDGSPLEEKDPSMKTFKKVYINPHVISEEGDEWLYNEGCLSLPGIHEDVKRKSKLHVTYLDEQGNKQDEVLDGFKARVFQHEYDHLDGKVFTDRLSVLKRRLMKGKLTDISKGWVDVKYKMLFPLKK